MDELIAVKMANATASSLGYHQPGDEVDLPAGEARELLRHGAATRVPPGPDGEDVTYWNPPETEAAQ